MKSSAICCVHTLVLCCSATCASCALSGAYQGRGRGNAFLSDLCDADVLVHVVDASGTTDSKGLAMGAAQTDGEGEQQQQQGAQHQEPDKADAGGEDPIEEVR